MTIHDLAISACVVGWGLSFIAPIVVPGLHVDPSLSLVLMALAGGLIAFRQRKEESSR